MLDFAVLQPYMPLLFSSVWITLKFTFFSTILGFLGGFILALITLSKKYVYVKLAEIYISIFRGTPLLVQLMLIYFATPQLTSFTISALQAGVLAFGLNSAAYISEALRGGILSVDRGQWEGAMSLGVPKHKMLLDIILPQAIKNVIPTLCNEFITLLKETSVAGYIALEDLTKGGDIIRSRTYSAFMPLMAVALIYLLMVILLEKGVKYIERRLKQNER